jgi:uncharacterized protein
MKKAHILFYLIGLSFLFNACKKDDITPEQVKEFSILSTNTGSNYAIWVVLPKNYNSSLKYETVYVLDANWPTMDYAKIAKMTEEKSDKYNHQNAIIVGINNNGNERNRDFTPTVTSEGGGGSEKYSKFIEFELIPKIESDYPVDTTAQSRVIMGHSYGGLLTCYFFTKHPKVFNNYLSLSAATWYDNDLLFQYEKDTRVSNSAINNLVFIGCGELEEWSVVRSQEWNYRLSTYYPNCKVGYNKLTNRNHNESGLENAEIGIDFYYKNK